MPNPTPTREEKDRALKTAKSWDTDPDFWHESAIELARCHLHATAELARAEERLRVCLQAVKDAHEDTTDAGLRHYLAGIIANDEHLARGESEETPNASTMADRALRADPERVLQQQDGEETVVADSGHVRGKRAEVTVYYDREKFYARERELFGESEETKMESESDEHVAIAVRVDNPQPECEWRDDTEDVETGIIYDRAGPRCPNVATHRRCGPIVNMPVCEEHKCRCDRPLPPAPAQAEPPAVASGVAGEVFPMRLFEQAFGAVIGSSFERALSAARDVWASRDAEVAEFRRALGSAKDQLDKWRGVIGEKDAEVAELKREIAFVRKRERESVQGMLEQHAQHLEDARQELEAEKAAHERHLVELRNAQDKLKTLAGRLLDARHDHAEAQKARAVPSREQIAETAFDAMEGKRWSEYRDGDSVRNEWLTAADAVLALFASPPASPDNTPPEPLPERLPACQRVWITVGRQRVEAVLDKQSTTLFEGKWYCDYIVPNGCGATHLGPEHIDWAHWRPRQNQDDERIVDELMAKRAAGLKTSPSSPDAGIEAVKAEVAELRRRIEGLEGFRP